MKYLFVIFSLLMSCAMSMAGTNINTVGSDDATAISGFDPVAFFTEKKSVLGKAEFTHEHLGAKWVFSSQANLELFQKNPAKYMPEWGGHCSWAVSENTISNKKLSGDFDMLDGKLYLYSFGNNARGGARISFWQSGGGPKRRVAGGDGYWLDIKQKLEVGAIVQPDSTNYKKSSFE